jgi:hypothetical protein
VSGTQQTAVKLLQTLTEFREKIKPYLPSYKCALAYMVEIEDKIVQLCIVLYPIDVSKESVELYYEPTTRVKIYFERMNVDEVFDSLIQFASEGRITLGNSKKEFVYSPDDLSFGLIQLLEKEVIRVLGRMWSSWGIKASCAQTLDKICSTFDFKTLYSILWKERRVPNLHQLIRNITYLPYLEVDSDSHPSIVILAPIYARINRCGLVKDKVKFYVETTEGLIDSPHLYINILRFSSVTQPSYSQLSFDKMKLSSVGDHNLHYLTYEMPSEGLDKVELDLKDHVDFSRCRRTIVITWIKILQERAKRFSCRSITISMKKRVKKYAFLLAILMPGILSAYALWFYMVNKILPDPVAAATVAMAIATVLMVYVSKKGLDVSQEERLKPRVEEALNEFLYNLKRSIETIIQEVNNDEPVKIVPERLEPKPHLLMVTYEEAPGLLRKLSKLLKIMLSYNVSIDPKDREELKISADDVLKEISALEVKLSQKYGIKSSPSEFSFKS